MKNTIKRTGNPIQVNKVSCSFDIVGKLQLGLKKLSTNKLDWDLLYLGCEPLDVSRKVLDAIVTPHLIAIAHTQIC